MSDISKKHGIKRIPWKIARHLRPARDPLDTPCTCKKRRPVSIKRANELARLIVSAAGSSC